MAPDTCLENNISLKEFKQNLAVSSYYPLLCSGRNESCVRMRTSICIYVARLWEEAERLVRLKGGGLGRSRERRLATGQVDTYYIVYAFALGIIVIVCHKEFGPTPLVNKCLIGCRQLSVPATLLTLLPQIQATGQDSLGACSFGPRRTFKPCVSWLLQTRALGSSLPINPQASLLPLLSEALGPVSILPCSPRRTSLCEE